MNKLASLTLVLLVGCAADDSSIEEQHNAPKQLMPSSQSPNFTLYVSNQSLDRSLLDIQIYIDGELAVGGDFNTFGGGSEGGCGFIPQHNWYEFNFAVPAGAREIQVVSEDVAATLDANVSIDARKFGVLTYWYDATTDEPEKFDFFAQDDQPYFQ